MPVEIRLATIDVHPLIINLSVQRRLMGLGPKWEGSFVRPAPPLNASPELRRYIEHLHDQLTTSFEGAKDIINRIVIGGDGDGGPGMTPDEETDGGSIPTDQRIVAVTSWGGSNFQWIHQRAGGFGLNELVGSNSTWGSLRKFNPSGAGQNWEANFNPYKAWSVADAYYATDSFSNNGESVDFNFKYFAGANNDIRWRGTGTPGFVDAGTVNFTPPADTAALVRLQWTGLTMLVGDNVGIQLRIQGQTPNSDQDFYLMGIRFSLA